MLHKTQFKRMAGFLMIFETIIEKGNLPKMGVRCSIVTTHFEKITHLKKNSKCVKFGTSSTHFEKKKFQSALNLGPALRTLKNFKLR